VASPVRWTCGLLSVRFRADGDGQTDTQDLIRKNSLTQLAVASPKRHQPRLRRFSWPTPYRALSPSSLSRHPLTKAEGEAAVGSHKRSGSASPSKGRMVARPVRARPARYLDRRLPEQYVEVQPRRSMNSSIPFTNDFEPFGCVPSEKLRYDRHLAQKPKIPTPDCDLALHNRSFLIDRRFASARL
jgi:hypothetical protein